MTFAGRSGVPDIGVKSYKNTKQLISLSVGYSVAEKAENSL